MISWNNFFFFTKRNIINYKEEFILLDQIFIKPFKFVNVFFLNYFLLSEALTACTFLPNINHTLWNKTQNNVLVCSLPLVLPIERLFFSILILDVWGGMLGNYNVFLSTKRKEIKKRVTLTKLVVNHWFNIALRLIFKILKFEVLHHSIRWLVEAISHVHVEVLVNPGFAIKSSVHLLAK